MDVRLIITKGRTAVRELKLRSAQTTIGRQKGCGLRIPSSQVSRRHCLLSIQDGYLTAEDLDSVNGTLLNGQLITGRQVVHPGDRLEVGPVCFLVEYQLSQAALQRLATGSGAPASPGEVDVLPLNEGEVLEAEVEALEALPEAEDIPEAAFADDEEDFEVIPEADAGDEVEELEPLAAEDDEIPTARVDSPVPESNELRDILEQMEGERPASNPSPKRKQR